MTAVSLPSKGGSCHDKTLKNGAGKPPTCIGIEATPWRKSKINAVRSGMVVVFNDAAITVFRCQSNEILKRTETAQSLHINEYTCVNHFISKSLFLFWNSSVTDLKRASYVTQLNHASMRCNETFLPIVACLATIFCSYCSSRISN